MFEWKDELDYSGFWWMAKKKFLGGYYKPVIVNVTLLHNGDYAADHPGTHLHVDLFGDEIWMGPLLIPALPNGENYEEPSRFLETVALELGLIPMPKLMAKNWIVQDEETRLHSLKPRDKL